MTEEATQVVRIERTFDARAEDVFDAWTSEEVDPSLVQADAGVAGGERRGGPAGGRNGPGRDAHPPTENRSERRGEYTVIERPHRLAFTWTFDDDPSNEQMIELEFSEQDGVTTVLFVNSDISEAERRDSQYEGWSTCFDEIARVLASK